MARERKRSAFTARDPGFAAKLEMPPAAAEPAATPRAQPDAEELPALAPQSPAAAQSQGTAQAATRKPPPRPARSSKDGVPVRINFSWPVEIVDRAAAMARDARCPVRTVLRHIWSEARASLVEALETGIPHTAVPAARAVGAGERFDSRLILSQEAHARLAVEIDPKGIAGLSSPLSRWARERMKGFAAAYLDRAGY